MMSGFIILFIIILCILLDDDDCKEKKVGFGTKPTTNRPKIRPRPQK